MLDIKHLCWFVALFCLIDTQELSPRVLNGLEALPQEYPYMASIRIRGEHYCGGVVVHEKWILTAAHCIFNQSVVDMSVVVGTTELTAGGIFYKVKSIVLHEMYQYVTDVIAFNDIGLLLLENPLRFNRNIQRAKLASKTVQPGLNTILMGWGRISQIATTPSNTLNVLSLATISNQQCATILTNRTLNIGNFCTGAARNQGGCFGDSGSPLVEEISGEVIGLYSWVVPPCGSGFPDGYTDVWQYLDWIKSHIEPYY